MRARPPRARSSGSIAPAQRRRGRAGAACTTPHPDRGAAEHGRRAAARGRVARPSAGWSACPRRSPDRCAIAAVIGAARRDATVSEGVRRRRERVEDRLVADRAAPRRARPSAAARASAPASSSAVAASPPRTRLEEGRAVQRARMRRRPRPRAGARRRAAAHRGRLGGQLGEHRLDRAEADHEVVAVVAVAEHGVEPGQVRGVPLDDDPAPRRRAARTAAASIDVVGGRSGGEAASRSADYRTRSGRQRTG